MMPARRMKMKVADNGVEIDTLIKVIKDAIKRAGVSRTSQNRDLEVASVKLILDVVASKTAGGGLDFRVMEQTCRPRRRAALTADAGRCTFPPTSRLDSHVSAVRLGLPWLFSPAEAAEILRRLGLPEMTECAPRLHGRMDVRTVHHEAGGKSESGRLRFAWTAVPGADR
jgi:hypothetical protein